MTALELKHLKPPFVISEFSHETKMSMDPWEVTRGRIREYIQDVGKFHPKYDLAFGVETGKITVWLGCWLIAEIPANRLTPEDMERFAKLICSAKNDSPAILSAALAQIEALEREHEETNEQLAALCEAVRDKYNPKGPLLSRLELAERRHRKVVKALHPNPSEKGAGDD